MNILILGGGGFLGYRLGHELLRKNNLNNEHISKVTLFDKAFPENRAESDRLEYVTGDLTDIEVLQGMFDSTPDLIFHLAAIVSGEAEKDFKLGMKVNLEASLNLLEICRSLQMKPRLVFASSCAVYGGDVTKPVRDDTAPTPQSSYGTQKAIVELLINDYSRRGFIDGVSLRLPTIAVRPGKPNAATSSFISSIIREPLNGLRASCPVPPETEVWIQSPGTVVDNFIHAASVRSEDLGPDRIVALPGLTTSVQNMVDGLGEVAGREATELIDWVRDDFLRSIVLTWPPHFTIKRAKTLGFKTDGSVDTIIKAYIEEEGPF